MFGFYIKELRVTGTGLNDAIVTFEKGLNVINGPSNTGKSYVFKCIDYMFGAEKLKKIKESKNYEKIFLEIRRFDNDKPITLLRFMNSNDIFYAYSSIESFENASHQKLKSKHDANSEDNISKFLLKLIGINENKVLVKNENGVKNTLSFRGVVNLTMISETDIISEEKSPIFDGVNVNNTYSKSLFKFFLTLIDDVLCEEIEKDEIRKAKIDAKIEYINNEVEKLNKNKDSLQEQIKSIESNGIIDINDYMEQIKNIESLVKIKKDELAAFTKEQSTLTLKRNKFAILLDKFSLLKKQYESDLKRLTFIQDGEDCLDQIQINHCPLCNGSVKENEFDKDSADAIIGACNEEKHKINIHLQELEKTIQISQSDFEEIESQCKKCNADILNSEQEIKKILENELKPLKSIISSSVNYINIVNKLKDIDDNINDKKREIVAYTESRTKKKTALNYEIGLSVDKYTEFCSEIKDTLKEFGYNQVETVTFNTKEQDIIIDEIPRKSNGKGYRAFFYTAFSVTLMKYLASKNHAFSNLLILDSPVTTLKEEDISKGNISDGDMIEASLQDSLFEYLVKSFTDKQVIILENKEIKDDIREKCNHIQFTKKIDTGRYGFFPIK